MKFTKVKLFICLLLFAVNVIFGFMCVRLINDKNYISSEDAALASGHLYKNGLEVSFEKDDRKIHNLPIYCAKEEESEDGIPDTYRKMTEAFFKTNISGAAYIKTPEGYSVSVKKQDGTLKGTSFLLSNGHFECYIENSVSEKDIEEIAKLPYLQKLTEKNEDKKTARNFIESAFKGYSVKFVYEGTRAYNKGNIVCFTGSFSDTASLNLYVNVYVKKGNIVCLAGMLPGAVPEKKYSASLLDSVNLMYAVREYFAEKTPQEKSGKLRIDDFELKYKIYKFDSSVYYLIPTWIVEYTDGNNRKGTITVDAVTGKNIEEIK